MTDGEEDVAEGDDVGFVCFEPKQWSDRAGCEYSACNN